MSLGTAHIISGLGKGCWEDWLALLDLNRKILLETISIPKKSWNLWDFYFGGGFATPPSHPHPTLTSRVIEDLLLQSKMRIPFKWQTYTGDLVSFLLLLLTLFSPCRSGVYYSVVFVLTSLSVAVAAVTTNMANRATRFSHPPAFLKTVRTLSVADIHSKIFFILQMWKNLAK